MNAIVLVKKEDSPKMKLKKALLKRVFKKAWFFYSQGFKFSKALKKAWIFEKTKNANQKNQFSLI